MTLENIILAKLLDGSWPFDEALEKPPQSFNWLRVHLFCAVLRFYFFVRIHVVLLVVDVCMCVVVARDFVDMVVCLPVVGNDGQVWLHPLFDVTLQSLPITQTSIISGEGNDKVVF